MCCAVQRESGRIVGDVSLIDLIGVIVGRILIEECFRRGIDIRPVENCQCEILVDQESGYIGGIMVCDRKIDPVAA